MRILLALGMALCALTLHAPSADAQVSGSIRAIVPFPAGGPLDTVAREITAKFRERFPSEPVIVENKGGANGQLGAMVAAQARPDGRTWLFAEGALVTVNPILYPQNNGFDAQRDLQVVTSIGSQPSILVVNPKFPAKTLKEFVEEARAKQIPYASGGIGSAGHLTMEYFGSVAGLKLEHIPYKGAQPAMIDLVSGQVPAAFVAIGGALPMVKAGKLRALAVSGPTRVATIPDVPTVKELGYPNFEVQSTYFVMVPSKTPATTVKALEDQIGQVLDDKSVQARLLSLGIMTEKMTPTQAEPYLSRERDKWSKLVKEKGIKPE